MGIEERAKAVLEARMGAIRKLATTAERIAALKEDLEELERGYGRDYRAAARSWSNDDLRSFGFAEPAKPKRARSASAPKARSQVSTAEGEHEPRE